MGQKIVLIVVGLLVVIGWLQVGESFVESDWEGKPSATELKRGAEKLKFPDGIPNPSLEIYSKITFVGFAARSSSNLSVADLEQVFANQAEEMKFKLVSRKESRVSRRLLYCDGRFARVIELQRQGESTKIHLGTYWHSNRKSDLYCR